MLLNLLLLRSLQCFSLLAPTKAVALEPWRTMRTMPKLYRREKQPDKKEFLNSKRNSTYLFDSLVPRFNSSYIVVQSHQFQAC
ncbi:hypothetical protein QQP08_011870 [Theobroma cacao]|nr:hypothetical protein QQP08_011870 [Theobroma cacao]